MNIQAVALSAAMALASPRAPLADPPPRVRAVVADVVSAVGAAPELPWSPEVTAVVLVETAYRESTFRPEVRSCEVLGDGGRAASGFQLHRFDGKQWTGRERICRDPVHAASSALSRLLEAHRRTNTLRGTLGAYLGHHGAAAARRELEVRRIATLLGLEVSP